MITVQKQPLVIEDLGKHTPEDIAEVRMLLEAGVVGQPDSHRSSFYALDGLAHVYYIFRYPSGQKVLLIATWQRVSGAKAAA